MKFTELLLLAVGLSMDSFAVSVCKGLSVQSASLKGSFICGIWFGSFQALMPLIGFYLGSLFADAIEAYDHWVAFGLLAVIGANMLYEAFTPHTEQPEDADLSAKSMFLMSVATSIDALAVGLTLSMTGQVNICAAVGLIGGITFAMSAVGFKIGSIFGCRYEKKAQAAGGIILILLGIRILLNHLR